MIIIAQKSRYSFDVQSRKKIMINITDVIKNRERSHEHDNDDYKEVCDFSCNQYNIFNVSH